MSEQGIVLDWSQERIDVLRGFAVQIFGPNSPAVHGTVERVIEELITFGVHALSAVSKGKTDELSKFKLNDRALYLTHLPMEKIQILGMVAKMLRIPEAAVVELFLNIGVSKYMEEVEKDKETQALTKRYKDRSKVEKSDIEVSREVEEILKGIMK